MTGTPQNPRELAAKLGVDLDNVTTPKPKAKPKAKAPKAETNGQAQTNGRRAWSDDLNAHPGVLKALETRTVRLDGTTDRSADAHRVARACFTAGLTAAACVAVMRERADLADWLDENPADEVARSYAKFEADDEATRFDSNVDEQVRKLRVREQAKRRFTIEQQGEAPPFDDGLLSEILCRPPEPPYRVDQLVAYNANTLVVAQRKTGKTSLNLNLARSFIDADPFLGKFEVRKISGRVGYLNYEMSAQQLGRWGAQAGIDPDRLYQVNLRGRRNPLAHSDDRAELARKLRSHEVESLIVDPFGRAYTGANQNDPGEVGAWLTDLDLFARAEAGVTDLILAAHAGWSQERTRGASSLEDWPDTIITMTRGDKDDDKDNRYLRAFGRDVDVEEDKLDYDPSTRRLTLSGSGSRRKCKPDNLSLLLIPIKHAVEGEPGISDNGLRKKIRKLREEGKLAVPFQDRDVSKAADMAHDRGMIRRVGGGGPGRPTRHYPVSERPENPRPTSSEHPKNEPRPGRGSRFGRGGRRGTVKSQVGEHV